jgi:hypothetical protein
LPKIPSLRSSGATILADDTAGAVEKIPDAVRIEIDGFGRERFVRCRVGQSHVRSVGVVVGFIVAQDAA